MLVVVSSNVFQITVTLFALVTSGWLPGVVIIVAETVQLLAVCMFGTVLIIKNQQFSVNVYDVAWHNLSIKDQKLLLFVLASSNRNVCFTFVMDVLNFESFVSVSLLKFNISNIFKFTFTLDLQQNLFILYDAFWISSLILTFARNNLNINLNKFLEVIFYLLLLSINQA